MCSPVQLWLFDQPPVTEAEIAAWVKENNNRINPGTDRYRFYVKHWNIAEKIAATKFRRLNNRMKPRSSKRRSR